MEELKKFNICVAQHLSIPQKKVIEKFRRIKCEGYKLNIDYYFDKPSSPEELIDRGKKTNANALVVVDSPINKKVMESLENLEMIAVAFTGYDHIDIEAAQERNVAVANAPRYAIHSVAELVFGMAINLFRKIRLGDKSVRRRTSLKRKNLKGKELNERTLGILGTGEIGSKVAKIGKALGMDVIAHSRTEKEEMKKIVEYVSLEDLFKNSDVLSVHVPLTDSTEGMIGYDEISSMKKGSIFINTARADVVDQQAFIKSAREKEIYFGIDVPHQNLPEDVVDSERVLYTPHVGYYTMEAMERRVNTSADNIEAYVNGKELNRIV